MAWGQTDSQGSYSGKSGTQENLFLKIVEGNPAFVRITVEDAVKRIVHKIQINGKVKAYLNCPGNAVCPICKMPKSAKDPKAAFAILSQVRYMVPVYNRKEKKMQLLDIPKTPKEEIDLMAKSYGDPRNYDIQLTRVGLNLKPMMSAQQIPLTEDEIATVQHFLQNVNMQTYVAPTSPEDIRKVLDEQHNAFMAANGQTSQGIAPAAPAAVANPFSGVQPASPAPVAPVATVTASNPFAAPISNPFTQTSPPAPQPTPGPSQPFGAPPAVNNPFAPKPATVAPAVQPEAPKAKGSIDEQLWG